MGVAELAKGIQYEDPIKTGYVCFWSLDFLYNKNCFLLFYITICYIGLELYIVLTVHITITYVQSYSKIRKSSISIYKLLIYDMCINLILKLKILLKTCHCILKV